MLPVLIAPVPGRDDNMDAELCLKIADIIRKAG